MQINQLPVIPQAPANDDVLAIEVNGITYKVSKSALASAILGTIDTTPTQSSTRLVQSGGVYNAIQQSTASVPGKSLGSVAVAATIPINLSSYSRIEFDFSAATNCGHMVMNDKNTWYYLSFLGENATVDTNLIMYAIKAKFTDSGITVGYCGYKNISGGTWYDRIGNSGYTLRNIRGYV